MTQRILRFVLLLTTCLACQGNHAATVATWASPSQGSLKTFEIEFGGTFPIADVLREYRALGVTTIVSPVQHRRGGPVYYPSSLAFAPRVSWMPAERDFIAETLTAADTLGINVWLAFNPPHGKYPGTDAAGLHNPEMAAIYGAMLQEIGSRYSHHPSLTGVWWEEANAAETADTHVADIPAFSSFCAERFGEPVPAGLHERLRDLLGAGNWVEPDSVWWRRFALFRNDVMTSFVDKMAGIARRYGLKTCFTFYQPERASGESWMWGYDAVGLERVCDVLWSSGFNESDKPYQNLSSMLHDFGPSYRGVDLARNYAYAFHGKPVCYFESTTPVFVQAQRQRYSASESFVRTYGDLYTGYLGQPEKAVSLFFGRRNMQNWLRLITRWQGGESPARVAVAINPVPFVLRFAASPQAPFRKNVTALMDGLTRFLDVDGLILGTRLARDWRSLGRYSLIIIPEEMGTGLSEECLGALRGYLAAGGKILVVATPLVKARADLTEPEDVTPLICGVSVEGETFRESLQPGGEFMTGLPPLEGRLKTVQVTSAEVLLHDPGGAPLLTRHENAYFSCLSCSPKSEAYLAAVVRELVSVPVALTRNEGLRILESVRTGNRLCISLWGPGKAVLQVRPGLAGLSGAAFELRDIVTGIVIARGSPPELEQGIPVSVPHRGQPFIVAAGNPPEMESFPGIYPSPDVFADMGSTAMISENPEVPVLVPNRKGTRVAVYHGGIGAPALIEVLNANGCNAYSIPRLDSEALGSAEIVVIPHVLAPVYFNAAAPAIRQWTANGGSVLLLHDAVGYRKQEPLFPAVGRGVEHPKRDMVKVAAEHPLTQGMPLRHEFRHAYADHVILQPGAGGTTILTDPEGRPVLVAATCGRGKVVLSGMLTGHASVTPGSYRGKDRKPEGEELRVLLNCVDWLR